METALQDSSLLRLRRAWPGAQHLFRAIERRAPAGRALRFSVSLAMTSGRNGAPAGSRLGLYRQPLDRPKASALSAALAWEERRRWSAALELTEGHLSLLPSAVKHAIWMADRLPSHRGLLWSRCRRRSLLHSWPPVVLDLVDPTCAFPSMALCLRSSAACRSRSASDMPSFLLCSFSSLCLRRSRSISSMER